ncbi:MAG: hypothetical protein P4L40_26090 [Terracidiphilus sp.]|nr:hypothetical protein [Terracidiphilus sp.]
MAARITSALILLTGAFLLSAQAPRNKPVTVTVHIFDGRSGERIVPDNVQVRVDRQSSNHIDWVKLADDGTATLTLPSSTASISVHASYSDSLEYYVNCDVSKQRNSARDNWYPLATILSEGLVMPNECDKARNARDLKFEAKPGEFVIFVRKRNMHDRVEEFR